MKKSFIDRFIAVMAAILIVCPFVTGHGYDDFVSGAESVVSVNALGHGAEGYRTAVNKDAAVVTIPAAEAPKAVVTTTAAAAKASPETTTTAKHSYASFSNCWGTGSAVPQPSIKLYSETKTVAVGETLRIDADYQYMRYITFESSGYMYFRYNSPSFTFSPYSPSNGRGYITVEISCDTPPGTYTVYAKGYHPEYEGPDEYKYAGDSISFEVIDPAASRTTTTTTRTTTTTTTTTRTTTTTTYLAAKVNAYGNGTAAPGSTIEIRWNSQYADRIRVVSGSQYLHCEEDDLYVSYFGASGRLKVSIDPDTPDGTYYVELCGRNKYIGEGNRAKINIDVKKSLAVTTTTTTTTTTTEKNATTTTVTYPFPSMYINAGSNFYADAGDTVTVPFEMNWVSEFKFSGSDYFKYEIYEYDQSHIYGTITGKIDISISPKTPAGKYIVEITPKGVGLTGYTNYIVINVRGDVPSAATTKKTATTTTRTTTATTTTSTTWTSTTMTYPRAQVHLDSYYGPVVPGSTVEIKWESWAADRVYVSCYSKYFHCEENEWSTPYYGHSGTLKVSIAPDTPDGTYYIEMWGSNQYTGTGDSDKFTIEVRYPYIIGDVDLDGRISIADAVTLQKYLLQTGELKQWRSADIDNDGRIDVFDLCLLKKKLLKNNLISTK